MYVLVNCTKLEQDFAYTVKEMYQKSTLFRKAVRYIEKEGYDDWFVLSAKYGLLHKHQTIEPYEMTLNSMNNSVQKKEWAKNVADQIKAFSLNRVDFYAGANYRQHLKPLLELSGIQCRVPLQGQGIGQQLQFFTNNSQ
ncbi:hypothetical protein N6H14_14860 [Paenibacillus sp. CC-CFT747]|nr:hypothetical protein N6H14_14860 [Paenibacillus sp. CC-CFT747]